MVQKRRAERLQKDYIKDYISEGTLQVEFH